MNFRKSIRFICSVLILLSIPFPAAAEDFTNAIHAYLQHCLKAEKANVGIVVGMVDAHGSSVVGCGKLDNGTDQEVNGDTVFAIRSMTTAFTGLLLQEMIQSGQMELDNPVAMYLPKSVKMPAYHGKQITLRNLVAETSGLLEPANHYLDPNPKRADNPLADFTIEKMYAYLSSYKLTQAPGAKRVHGGVQMGLLGHVIALKAGTNYESLVVDRICRPLKMNSTRFTLTPELKSRLAIGHNKLGYAMPTIAWGAEMPIGGLNSTANDLLKFVSANLGLTPSSLTPLMEKSMINLRFARGGGIVWFNGGGHYESYVGFDKARQRGVVILSSSSDFIGAISLGNFLLGIRWQSDRRPTEAKISDLSCGSYVGLYQLISDAAPRKFWLWPFSRHKDSTASQSGMGIRSEGDRLFAQATGSNSWPADAFLPPIAGELLPESQTHFFERLSGTPITFSRDSRGKVTGLTAYYRGRAFSYRKISDQPPKALEAIQPRVAIKLSTKLLEACVGHYEFAPNAACIPDGMKVTIRREGDQLIWQAWGKGATRGALDIYPESATNFFIKINSTDTQLFFIKNDKGEVTALIHHEVGYPDLVGKKVRNE